MVFLVVSNEFHAVCLLPMSKIISMSQIEPKRLFKIEIWRTSQVRLSLELSHPDYV
jgi:hypothetical protein